MIKIWIIVKQGEVKTETMSISFLEFHIFVDAVNFCFASCVFAFKICDVCVDLVTATVQFFRS